MIDRKSLKAAAREAMREAKPHPFWVTAVTAVITAVLMVLAMHINGTFDTYRGMYAALASGQIPDMETTGRTVSAFGSFLVLALEVMTMVVSVGYVLYCLRIARCEKASFGDVFDAFGIFFRAVILRVMRSLIITMISMGVGVIASLILGMVGAVSLSSVSLTSAAEIEETVAAFSVSPWLILGLSVVMLIPVIHVSYAYRLGDYFMLDHPEMNCVQCLTMSRMAMRGRKWELFKLDLSFLGWMLLSIIPFVNFWVQPYITVTEAGFYNSVAPSFMEDLQNKLRETMQDLGAPNTTHGYHVPGEGHDDHNDDNEWE